MATYAKFINIKVATKKETKGIAKEYSNA